MAENMTIDSLKYGTVNISDDVLGVIASIAAAEIKGIKSLSGTLSEEVLEKIGKKNFHKGVSVEMQEGVAKVELHLVVDFGTKIHEVAALVQENVKVAIESMTGITVSAVDIYVEHLNTKKDVSK